MARKGGVHRVGRHKDLGKMSNWQKISEVYPLLTNNLKGRLIRRLLVSVMGLVPFDKDEVFRILDSSINALEVQAEGLGSSMDFHSGGRSTLAQFGNYQLWLAEVDTRLQAVIEEFKVEQILTRSNYIKGK
jgi:hypothetical protein